MRAGYKMSQMVTGKVSVPLIINQVHLQAVLENALAFVTWQFHLIQVRIRVLKVCSKKTFCHLEERGYLKT